MAGLAQNPDELFDVVNEQNEVIRQERRAVVHAQNLLHRAVHVLLWNRAGEVFLQKRSPLKDESPGCWGSSCSGHLDVGESYAPAAERELQEELGIALTVDQLEDVGLLEGCRETAWEFVRVYVGRHEGPFAWNVDEISDGKFWPWSELQTALAQTPELFPPCFRQIFRVFRDKVVRLPEKR